MSNFLTTTFKFITEKENATFYIDHVKTYGVNGWVTMPINQEVQGFQNQGIQYLNIINKKISANSTGDSNTNGVLSLQIDPEIVNQVPYTPEGASLLICVNGSNIEIDIHKNGGIKSVGTSGDKSVTFEPDFGNVGNTSFIFCS
ncbi:hypothetical protein [Tenacibaculum sp. 190524A02b]|uniref:hypothetical protein n=1 Tax=Tenacibaculum vairaonense TaxID=3137860 RepID=UPI0031FA653E